MDNPKNDQYYIDNLREDLRFITKHMENVDMEELCTNEVLQGAMLFRLIQISENAKKLSEEYLENHKDIPWNSLYGLRNRIVHDYGNVNLEIVYNTLHSDIPELLEMI